MAKLCEMKVTGKTSGTVVVANNILRGKVTRVVAFNDIKQVKGALSLERNQIIRIHGELPAEVNEKLNKEGVERFSAQTVGKETDAPLAGTQEVKFPEPSTEKPEDENVEGDTLGDFPVPSTENNETEEVVEGEVEAFDVPSTENTDEDAPAGVTREDIIGMTIAEMKSHIKANGIDIKGISKMNNTQLTNALLTHYGEEEMTEEEEAK